MKKEKYTQYYLLILDKLCTYKHIVS